MDLTRKRGDTYADEIVLQSRSTGAAINITGCSFVLTVDPHQYPTDAAANLFALDGTILDAAAGRVEFAPSSGQANQVGSYWYDIQMTDAVGRKRTILSGRYTFVQDIGKA